MAESPTTWGRCRGAAASSSTGRGAVQPGAQPGVRQPRRRPSGWQRAGAGPQQCQQLRDDHGSATRRCGIKSGIIAAVAMTLRLSDEEAEALRQRAALEGRSMQEVARQAIREYVEQHSRADLLERVLDEEVPRYAEALRRLAE